MRETSEEPTVRKRPKDRVDRILAAATELFRKDGYHTVGMVDVGAAVGITASAVYRHFPSKSALLIAVVEHELTGLIAKVEQSAAKAGSPQEALRLIDAALARETSRERVIATIYTREVRHAPFDDRAGIRALQRRLSVIWSDALRALAPELERDEADYVVLSSYGALASQFFFESPLGRRRLEEVLIECCLVAQQAWRPAERSTGSEPEGVAHRTGGVVGQSPDLDGPVTVTNRASRREMILQAAVALLRRYGYQGVTIDDIGGAAGISGPGVYRHFMGKEDILVAAYQRAWEQMMAGVAKALDGPGPAGDVLGRLVASYVEVAFDNADLIVVYLRDDQHLGADQQRGLRHKQRLYIDEWVRIVREITPDLGEDEVRVRVHAALGIVNSAIDIPTRLAEGQRRVMVEHMVRAVLLGA